MDFVLAAPLRTRLTAAAVALAGVAVGGACSAEDYRDQTSQDGAPAPYHGPYLTWAGKVVAPPPAPPPQARPAAPAYSAPAYSAPPPQPAPEVYRAPAPAAPLAMAYARPTKSPMTAAPAAAQPVAPPVRSAAPTAQSAPAAFANRAPPKPPAIANPAPPHLATPQAPAAPQAAAPQAPPSAPVGVRFYSLHRDYGMTPDPVPLPAARPPVLIAAPAGPPAQSQDDSDDGDKSAHKGDGQNGDD
jgi:hypothetical protein